MTLLLDEIAMATARLAEAGVDSPRTDAEVIAAHVHGVPRTELHLVPDSGFEPRFWDEIARREAREPLQHITGLTHFRYTELEVGPGVFVPRPETEVMSGWAIGKLQEMDVADPVVADLGTGSGAIALAIAQEVPRARVHAIEADPLDGQVDLVISNPPYIPVGATVPPEVGEYDPAGALWGGGDGLDAIRVIEKVAARLLRPDGLVAVEHGAPQGAAVYWVFAEERGWADTRNHKDLAGRDRFVTARWPGR